MAKQSQSERGEPDMASETDRGAGSHADTSAAVENKTEAVLRALEVLGPDAKPLAIQQFVKDQFGVEIATKVISVYKGKLAKGRRKRGRPARKAKETAVAASAPKAGGNAEVTIKDLRAIRELRERVGAGRLRELLELLA